ncbi:3-dehydroquinate synthase [Candidatus Peregrinibacteria bacterium]|nr:3-dehydroquinate synthase [Candidatus Peregrinibacteria bacterium]
MKTITLKTPSGASKILIQEDLFNEIGDRLKKDYPNSRFAIVTDGNLEPIYGNRLKKMFPGAVFLTIPAGEASKNFERVISLCEHLLKEEFARADVLIGFGGGMVTDVAGFVASIYMRGMKYVAIPTSLLGMVDAAIGGKTGIDFMAKNIIGTFYLAKQVLIDPSLLKSFEVPSKMPGMGEVIKYAATIDKSLFDHFVPFDLETVITKSAQAKVSVVEQDFRESGQRRILNYGHTFGHAIETAANYQITHDQAISIGMVLANKVAQNLGKQNPDVGDKIKRALDQFALPTALPTALQLNQLLEYIKKDKKRTGDIINYVIVTGLGKSEIIPMKPEELVKLAK